jgi:hypothetical protein
VFVGGASGEAAALFLQNKNGSFTRKPQTAFETDKASTDTDAVFFDANGDKNVDLYIVSGGYANFMPDDPALQDRLYLGDGKGNFTKSLSPLPKNTSSKSCARVADVNGDGALDVFVGGRVVVGRYPETPLSSLLINDGKGNFSDQIATLAPALQKIGMVTDAAWCDLNGDVKPELIVVGEFMPISVFSFQNNMLTETTPQYFSKKYAGLWQKLLVQDLNSDGKMDILVGNQGVNTQIKASETAPAELYFKDFDDNGSVDPILCFENQGKSYPYVTRDELLDQMSLMRTRFADYKSYADATLKDIFKPEELKGATRLEANTLKTTLFIAQANGKFEESALPILAQAAPIHTTLCLDIDKDGKKDVILAGNAHHARLKFGKMDANLGLILRGDGQGNFTPLSQQQAGLRLVGDVRSGLVLGKYLLFGIGEMGIVSYKMR